MDSVIRRKVGVVSCSGEELAEGTVARLATLKVLHDLRPKETVTICLPLFLAGGEGDREFARFHPTITVDGCALRCAARGTEMYSGKPAASVVVNDLLASAGLPPPAGTRSLDEAGRRAVDVTAEHLGHLVDELIKGRGTSPHADPAPLPTNEVPTATCACGGGVPAANVAIGEGTVRVLALPLLFAQFRLAGREAKDSFATELLEMVKIYNDIPREDEGRWSDALLAEYRRFCTRESNR
jgi:uncharacterized metal-binding protein